MSEFFETVRDARSALHAIDTVGTHLDALGIQAGADLHAAVDRLEECIEAFKRLDGEAVAGRLRDAQQGAANMLAVAIGMARLQDGTPINTKDSVNASRDR